MEKLVSTVTIKSLHYTGLDRHVGLQEVEAPRIFRQSAHEDSDVARPTHRPAVLPGDIAGTHFG